MARRPAPHAARIRIPGLIVASRTDRFASCADGSSPCGVVREEFSPSLYHLFTDYVASYVAARLGRSLFQSDRPELLQSVNEYYASLQQDATR